MVEDGEVRVGGARSSGAGHLSEALYGAGFSLLFAHEVDSGYWREWELFHLPGGVSLFVLLHIAMGALLLAGFRSIVLGERAARAWTLLLAAGGTFAFGIHMTFIALGHEQFRRPASVGVLAALLVVSVVLAAVTLRGEAGGATSG